MLGARWPLGARDNVNSGGTTTRGRGRHPQSESQARRGASVPASGGREVTGPRCPTAAGAGEPAVTGPVVCRLVMVAHLNVPSSSLSSQNFFRLNSEPCVISTFSFAVLR